MMKEGYAKLHRCSFGFAFGILNAIFIFILGMMAWIFGWGTEIVTLTATFHKGFAPSLLGSIIGAIWGFVEGFIFGYLVALFYNWSFKCCAHKCGSCDTSTPSNPAA